MSHAVRQRRRLGSARLRMEELEPRWAMTWGSIPPASIAPPTATAVAVTLDANNTATGSASIASSEVDYVSFIAGATGSYTISTATPNSNLDTVLGVFSATGQRLAFNDDQSYPGNLDSKTSLNLTAGTKYFVGITNYTATAGGDYNWSIVGPRPIVDDAFENNDTRQTAHDFGRIAQATTYASLNMADGHDWYKFNTGVAGTSANYLQIDFVHSLGDVDMELTNATGGRLVISQGVTNSERISLANRAAGTYYVHVFGYRGATNPSYSLTLNTPGSTPPPPTIDLAGGGLTGPSGAIWGQTITVSAAVKNLGNTASGAFSVQWVFSQDAVGSSDDIVLSTPAGATTTNFASVAANATGATISTQLRLPTALPTGWTGSDFYIVMRVDVGSQVTETNENNNFGQVGLGLDSNLIRVGDTLPVSGFEITLNISGMTPSQTAIFRQAAARWAEVIIGDIPDATYNGQFVDDVLIDASGQAIDGPGGILGQAGPDAYRPNGGLATHGIMEFDTADLASLQQDGSLFSVILHEMGHVLGIGTLWNTRGLLSGRGTSNPRFTGAQATAAYNQIFGRNETGVPVENTGGSGTRDAHWRESVFGSELMTGWIGPGTRLPLSRITVGSLADLGYQVNMSAADNFNPASMAGATSSSGGGSSTSSRQALLSSKAVDYWMAQLGSSHVHEIELAPL